MAQSRPNPVTDIDDNFAFQAGPRDVVDHLRDAGAPDQLADRYRSRHLADALEPDDPVVVAVCL